MIKKFSFDTIVDFDKHILCSIPNYDVLFESLLRIAEFFVIENKAVYDVGCSTGKLLLSLAERFPKNKLVGLDSSVNLLPKDVNLRPIFITTDLNNSYQFSNACLIFSIFTLQFLRKERRQKLVDDAYAGLCQGGALIIAEKTYAALPCMQDIFTFSYYDYKKNSFSEKEILDKERDLRPILKPNTTEENLAMLKKAGFKKIESFYKYFMFEAFIAIK